MERDGLLKRIPKKKGKPFTEIKITPKGEEAMSSALPIHKAVIEELASELPAAQQQTLQDSLRDLRDKALEKINLEAKPTRGAGEPISLKW
jgi:DNA-binding MarR family transcriptional regulator